MTKIKIDNIELSSPVLLAPMSGVTDWPYRKLVKKLGAGLVISEMIASRAMLAWSHQALQKSKIDIDDATGSCVQLAGCDPQAMAETAKMNENMGAKIIDINFGCPAKKVVGGFAGSALMHQDQLTLATKILQSTVKAVKIPVTLKMRTGWDDNSRNAPLLAKIAEDCGIKMITIHGRTRCQFYKGRADWQFISEVKQAIKIPVIANGDIVCIDSAVHALKSSGADGIMIGRGCYGKPWLIAQISHFLLTGEKTPEPAIKSQLEIILEHYQDMIEHYGDDIGVKFARKHLGWYSSGLPNSSEFRASINQMESAIEVQNKLQEFYSKLI